jgi:putative membrane protein
VALLVAGALVIAIAFVRMRRVRARIRAGALFDDDALAADGLLMLLVAALFGLLGMFGAHAV